MGAIPGRAPLNEFTLMHILGQCKSSAARRRVIKREIALICNGHDWGIFNKAQAITYLDRLTWVFRMKQEKKQ